MITRATAYNRVTTIPSPGCLFEGPAAHRTIADSAALAVAVALTLLVWLPGPPYRAEQFQLPKAASLGATGVVCALWLLHSVRRAPHRAEAYDDVTAVALLWGAALTLAVAQSQAAAWFALGQYAAAFALFQVARRVGASSQREHFCFTLCALLSITAGLVLLEAYGAVGFFSEPGRRAGGTLGNRNLAARLLCVGLPLFWRQLTLARGRVPRLATMLGIGILTAAITLSRSRGAWVVGGVLVILLPVVTRHLSSGVARATASTTRVWYLVVMLAIGVTTLTPNRLGFGPSAFASSASRVLDVSSGTGRGRLIQATTTWRMIRARPLGIGPGNWSIIYPVYAVPGDPSFTPKALYPAPRMPRGDWLSLTAEFGLVGLALLLGGAAAMLRRLVDALRCGTAEVGHSAIMGLAVAGAVAALGLVDPVVRLTPTLAEFAVIMGVACGHAWMHRPECKATRRAEIGARLAWSGCAVLAMLSCNHAARELQALRIIRSASGLGDLERAVAVAPQSEEARVLLAYGFQQAGRCDLAAPHLAQAAQLQPFSGAVAAIRSGCLRPPSPYRGP